MRLISVDRESILEVRAKQASKSAEEGSMSPMSADAVCVNTEALDEEEMDLIQSRMAAAGGDLLGISTFGPDFGLLGAIGEVNKECSQCGIHGAKKLGGVGSGLQWQDMYKDKREAGLSHSPSSSIQIQSRPF